jgi:hypothetical protein
MDGAFELASKEQDREKLAAIAKKLSAHGMKKKPR